MGHVVGCSVKVGPGGHGKLTKSWQAGHLQRTCSLILLQLLCLGICRSHALSNQMQG